MKLLLFICLITSSSLMAGEVCVVRHFSSCDGKSSDLEGQFVSKKAFWEDCFNQAIDRSKRISFISKKVFHFKGSSKPITRSCINYMDWAFHESDLDDLRGSVTRYSLEYLSGPRLGDQRFKRFGDKLNIPGPKK